MDRPLPGPLHPTALVVGLADHRGRRECRTGPPGPTFPPTLRRDKGRTAWTKLFPEAEVEIETQSSERF